MSRGLRFGACLASLVAAGALVPILTLSSTLVFATVVLAFAVALVGAHVMDVRRTGDRLSLLSVVAAFYFVAFACGGVYYWILGSKGSASFTRADLLAAVGLAALSWTVFALTYTADPLRLLRLLVPALPRRARGVALSPALVFLLGIGWLSRLEQVREGRYYHIKTPFQDGARTGITWFVDSATLFPMLAAALLGAVAFHSEGSRKLRALFWLLLAVELAWYVPAGARQSIVNLAILVLVVRYYALGRLPNKRLTALVLAMFIFVVFPLIARYRGDEHRNNSPAALTRATNSTLDRGASGFSDGISAFARLSDAAAVARIVNRGQDAVDRNAEDVVRESVGVFVPRALYPEKSDPTKFANQFGRSYGFLQPGDHSTAISVTPVGDLFIVGGWFAVIIGSCFIGGLFRVVNDYFAHRRDDPVVLAIYAVVLPKFVFAFENSISVGAVASIKSTIFLTLAAVLASRLGTNERGPALKPVQAT